MQQTKTYADKIIVCDDGSVDKTCEIAQAFGATVVKHQRNLGYGAALFTLFKEANKLSPDVMVTLDADGQHDPTYIPKLIQPILSNSTDVVIGTRFLSEKNQRNLPAYREIGIRLITRIARTVSCIGITDAQSGFRAYGRKALQAIQPEDHGMAASTEILIKAKQANLIMKEVPITISYKSNSSKQNPITHWSLVILNTLKTISKRCSQIFYGVPGIVAVIIALGLWIRASPIYTDAGQTNRYFVSVAIGTTIAVTALLMVAIILWKPARATRWTGEKE